MIVAGIGYSEAAGLTEIEAAVRRAMAEAGIAGIDKLAVPGFKSRNHQGPEQAATLLGAVLVRIGDDALAQAAPFCMTKTARAMPGCGHASVCEAAALAGAGEGAVLIASRLVYQRATCALAQGGKRVVSGMSLS